MICQKDHPKNLPRIGQIRVSQCVLDMLKRAKIANALICFSQKMKSHVCKTPMFKVHAKNTQMKHVVACLGIFELIDVSLGLL